MRTPTGSLHSAALLVCAALVLTACSDDPQQAGSLPGGTPSATSSSAVPSPDTPEEQVEAAVRAYYAELTRAAQTQDTTRFKKLVTSGCPCFNAAKAIEKTERRGLTTPSAEWRVDSIVVHELENASAVAEVEYRVTAYEVINDAGDVVDRYEAQSGHVDLSLVKSDRGWIVGNLFDLEG